MRLLCDISVRQKIHGIDVANTWSHLVLTAIKNCQYDDDIDLKTHYHEISYF